MPFDGLRVLSLESRRSAEIATLIRNQGGEAVVAPSMREVPVSDQSEAYRFFERLRDGDFDMTILLTGSEREHWPGCSVRVTGKPLSRRRSSVSR